MKKLENKENEETHLERTIVALRLGMEGMAGERMAFFIDALAPRLATSPPAIVQCLNPLLIEILSAQTRGDFARMADLLQFEVRPLLAAAKIFTKDRPE